MKPCSPGDGWTPVCPWEVVNSFFLFCLHEQLLFFLLNWFYLNPWIFQLLPFLFSPWSHWWGSEGEVAWIWLLARVKPWQVLAASWLNYENHTIKTSLCILTLQLKHFYKPKNYKIETELEKFLKSHYRQRVELCREFCHHFYFCTKA